MFSVLKMYVVVIPFLCVTSSYYKGINAFLPSYHYQQTTATATSSFGKKETLKPTSPSILFYTDTPDDDVSEIKASEMKRELESYGISTRSMFDRDEFEKALKEARLDNLKEKIRSSKKSTVANNKKNDDSKTTTTHKSSTTFFGGDDNNKTDSGGTTWSSKWKNVADTVKAVVESRTKKVSSNNCSSTKDEKSTTATVTNNAHREELFKLALEEGKDMKLSDLKKELTDRGISSSSFFEKSDLINLYANAIADQVERVVNDTKKETRSYDDSNNNEKFGSFYKDVIMCKFDPRSIAAGDIIIDITADTTS